MTVLGNVSLRTLPALRGSKSRRVTPSAYRLIRLSLDRTGACEEQEQRSDLDDGAQLAAELLSQPHAEELRDPI